MSRFRITSRFPRSLSDAFGDVRAGCVEHYTRPPFWKRLMRAIWRWL